MFEKIERLSESDFKAQYTGMIQTAHTMWSTGAALAVQAILHYLDKSRDVSWCQRLDSAFEEAGLGSHQSAFRRVLRLTTNVNMSSDPWKGGKADASLPEDYEKVIQDLIDGKGPSFMGYRKVAQKTKGEKSASKKATVDLGSVPAPVVNALQKLLDSKTPEQVTAMVNNLEKGTTGPEFDDPEIQVKWEKLAEDLHTALKIEGSFPKPDGNKPETAKDKVIRILSGAGRLANSIMEDWEAVKAAALIQKDAA